MRKTAEKKEACLQMLRLSLGIVSSACDKIGINRTTFYRWCKTDKSFQEEVDDISERALDFGETQLHLKMQGVRVRGTDLKGKDGQKIETYYTAQPDTTAIIFFLKTKGRKRGYQENVKVINEDHCVGTFIVEAPKDENDKS